MKKGHIIRFKNLIETLRPLYATIAPEPKRSEPKPANIPVVEISESTAKQPIVEREVVPEIVLPVKRPNKEESKVPTSVAKNTLGANVDTLKNQLEDFISQRNETFEVMYSISVFDIEFYQKALDEIKRFKSLILNYLNK